MEIRVPPDGVAFTVAYLRSQYVTHGESATVGSKIREPRPARFTKVRLMGGFEPDIARYAPMLTFECWAPTEIDASALGRLTFALINALPDIDSTCTRIVGVGGLVEQPDPDSGTPRYVFTSQLYMRSTVLV